MMMQHCRDLVAATDLPISGDLEKGKGDSADSAGETIFAAEAAGLGRLFDRRFFRRRPTIRSMIFRLLSNVLRPRAKQPSALKRDFVFTARAENFLHGKTDFDDTIKRLQAFETAGADVLYAPGICDIDLIRTSLLLGFQAGQCHSPRFASQSRACRGGRQAYFAWSAPDDHRLYGGSRRSARDSGQRHFRIQSRQAMPFSELQQLFSQGAQKDI